MIVIADTSPVSYLILIDEVDVLPSLYGEIIVPRAVYQELTAENAPPEVKDWFLNKPNWFEIRELITDVPTELSVLLDKGESEAIQLATDLDADLLLIDELAGRRIAAESGLKVVGLIGVLAAAGKRGLIDANLAASKLEKTKFYVSAELIEVLRNSRPDL